jgi:hypothetical protein
MAYDSSRPVPWRRLLREATIYVVVASLAVAFIVKHPSGGTYIGLVGGMAFYVLFVAVLAKFGYERQTLRQLRERSRATPRQTPTSVAEPVRQRPAPTRRTSTGPSQRPNRSTKKRRR